jgi:hypothetical protein
VVEDVVLFQKAMAIIVEINANLLSTVDSILAKDRR